MQSPWTLDPSSQSMPPSLPDPSPPNVRDNPLRAKYFWRISLALLALVILLVAAVSFGSSAVQTAAGGLGLFASKLFALFCALWIALRSRNSRATWAWTFIALAQGIYVIGYFISFSQPTPTTHTVLTDLFYLPYSALVALGVILFPASVPGAQGKLHVVVDVAIVVGAVFAIAWVFLISPHLASGAGDFIFIIYPFTDLALLLILILLLARGVSHAYQPVFFWLILGALPLAVADSVYNYATLPGGSADYANVRLYLEPLWAAAAFAFGLAALYALSYGESSDGWNWLQRLNTRATRTDLRLAGFVGQFFSVAAPVLVLFGLLILINIDRTLEEADVGLLITTLLVMLLIITRQLLTRRDLVQAQIATQRAEQLDTLKDQFITSVNHELRTPMMTMQGYIELMGELLDQVQISKLKDMLDRARRANSSLVQLVQSILDTRRIDQEATDFVPEPVNIHDAAQAALTLINPREADVSERQLVMNLPGDLVVWGEPTRVQQVLTNLLSNAIKYSAKGAAVRVTARLVSERESRLIAFGRRREPWHNQPMVEIVVRDWGLGIPPDQIPLLFRRFVRLPRDLASSVHGTGLGLHLCRVFTQAMGGTIWVESTGVPGEGSTFYVRLPVPPEHALSVPLAPARAVFEDQKR
ncbi:MAG TPA: HAMP domain-containing sensor histidine kinase [Ktedonobacterales bacterium]|nr:HAMP domain-containing sensor histidine kinase [Ktedonobacterales bacterium]